MNSNQKLLVLFASLLSLPAVVACGGSTGASEPEYNATPAPSASSSSSSQGDAGAPNPNNGSPTDAGTPVSDAGTTTTVASNCSNLTLTHPELCVENVSGHAGDIVNVPIDFIETAGCTDALEADGHLVLNSSYFQLANPAQQINCVTRDLFASPAPGTIEIMWNAFGPGQVAGCTADLSPGKLDTVQIEILPGTPSGDYDVTWLNADIAANPATCAMFDSGIKGTIHVD